MESNARSGFAARTAIWGAGVLLITGCVFARVVNHDFVTWDDSIHVYDNPYFHPLNAHNLLQFWLHPYEKLYIPLSYTFYALLFSIAGRFPVATVDFRTGAAINAHVFHAASLILHLINTLLVFVILRRLVRKDMPSALGALLFALHPLQVESVAWVSEIRGLLSASFCLAAILLYTCVQRAAGWNRLAIAWGGAGALIVLALLCKPSAIIVPGVLLIVGWLIQRRPLAAVAMETLPLLLLAIPFLAITHSSQPMRAEVTGAWYDRPFVAGDALAFYMAKLVAPVRLCIDYSRRPVIVLGHWWGFVTSLAPIAAIAVAWVLRRRAIELAAGLSIFVVVLLPELGLVPFNYQEFSTVADRYAYLALLGPAVTVAFLLSRSGRSRFAVPVAAASVVLAGLTIHQIGIWQDSLVLNQSCVAVSPNSAVCHCNYANALFKSARYTAARDQYLLAIKANPNFQYIYTGLGDVYMVLGQYADASNCYTYAAYRSPKNPVQYQRLARAQMQQGHYYDAIKAYTSCVQLAPRNMTYWLGLGDASFSAKRYGDAMVAYHLVLMAGAPNLATLRKFGIAALKSGQYSAAVWALQAALSRGDGDAQTARNLAEAERRAGMVK